jgi:hypothetical protein
MEAGLEFSRFLAYLEPKKIAKSPSPVSRMSNSRLAITRHPSPEHLVGLLQYAPPEPLHHAHSLLPIIHMVSVHPFE